MATLLRAAIVGASSLSGKELADQLNQISGALWDLTLLDTAETAGQMTAAGDEALLIQPLTPDSFAGTDVAFFAADARTTREHWRHAVQAGAGVVDLTGELAGASLAAVRAPLLAAAGLRETRLDLSTEAVAAAHPVSLMLACVGARVAERWSDRPRVAATVLLPASEQGKAGVDELQAQTVALLSFQTLPTQVYDTQAAFNLNAGLGASAQTSLRSLEARVAAELNGIIPSAAGSCAFRCVQAPVFHGCSASVFLQFDEAVEVATLIEALQVPGLLTFPGDQGASPSTASLSEQDLIQASVQADAFSEGKGLWLWFVADNLQLQARAIACANELLAMRPAGRVQ